MDILLFDIGNTNIKTTLADRRGLLSSFVLPTRAGVTSDELGLQIRHICEYFQADARSVGAWVVSSVVPHYNALLRTACSRFFSCPIFFVPEDIPIALENRYARPEEVGADRLVTAFSARRLFSGSNLIVVDFGTATTIECVQDNAYLGGLICPGLLSSLEALGGKTAKLPRISLEADGEELEFGQSTVQSMNQGMLHGFSAMISGLAEKIQKKIGPAQIIATGGFSRRIAAVCPAIDQVRPDLLMHGLHTIYFENFRE